MSSLGPLRDLMRPYWPLLHIPCHTNELFNFASYHRLQPDTDLLAGWIPPSHKAAELDSPRTNGNWTMAPNPRTLETSIVPSITRRVSSTGTVSHMPQTPESHIGNGSHGVVCIGPGMDTLEIYKFPMLRYQSDSKQVPSHRPCIFRFPGSK